MENYTGYYKAEFIGLFYPNKSKRESGKFSFSTISWHLLHLKKIELVPNFDLFSNKCDDFLFHENIVAKKSRSFDNNTEIIFENKYSLISGNLKNVLIKNTSLPNGLLPMQPENLVEMHGNIYFQLFDEKKKSTSIANILTRPNHVNGFNDFSIISEGAYSGETTTRNNGNETTPIPGERRNTGGLSTMSAEGNSFIPKWLIKLIILFAAAFFYYEFRYLILLLGLPWILSGIFKGNRVLRIVAFVITFVLLLLIGYFMLFKPQNKERVQTDDGQIKISPPIEVPRKDGNKGNDLLNTKEITWYDFIPYQYNVKYTTSSVIFKNTQISNSAFISQIEANPENDPFSKIYQFLSDDDKDKIDSLIIAFKKDATAKNLNMLQTAEMVCTFVQEIPYCLVHDKSCEEIDRDLKEGFVVEYHQQKKPCLPNVPAGVQSPFEFIHNLKGDCDTRSLFAFTILKAFHIPCSIWVSSVYGHSILGVGLPIGSGFYKDVMGQRHYGIELTAKGFRIGEIAGEQRNVKNWDIALTYNQ